MKYHQVTEKEANGGWSDWQIPIKRGYKMACCDCGLVHDMEFMIIRSGRPNKSGFYKILQKFGVSYKVMMRAKRNKRSTSAMRRNKKFKK